MPTLCARFPSLIWDKATYLSFSANSFSSFVMFLVRSFTYVRSECNLKLDRDNFLCYLIGSSTMQSFELQFGIAHLFHPFTKLLICPIETIWNVFDHLLEEYLDIRTKWHCTLYLLLAHFDIFRRLSSPLSNCRVAIQQIFHVVAKNKCFFNGKIEL